MEDDKPRTPESGVEFGTEAEHDGDGMPDYLVFGGVALFCGAIAGALAWPGTWDTQIVDYTGRRGAGLINLLESVGQVAVVAIFAAIATIALLLAIRDLRTTLKED
jgi:hypothetical protein